MNDTPPRSDDINPKNPAQEMNEEDKAKILEGIEAIKAQLGQSGLNHIIEENSSKLIECKHEIVISVIAHVIAEDEENLTIGTKEICRKNYHIPVPSNVEYNMYLKGFFDFLENCMSTSAQKMEASQDIPKQRKKR